MDIKDILAKKKFIKSEKVSKLQSWQAYAIDVCKEFEIKNTPEIKDSEGKILVKKMNYTGTIFMMANGKLPFLQAKVTNMREMLEMNPKLAKDLENDGKLSNYFFATLRKSKTKKY